MNADQLPSRMSESGVSFVIQDPGDGKTIACLKHGGVVELTVGSGTETRTLANPVKSGLDLTICVKSAGGGTANVSGLFLSSTTAKTSGAFDATTKYAIFKSVNIGGTLKWVITTATATFT